MWRLLKVIEIPHRTHWLCITNKHRIICQDELFSMFWHLPSESDCAAGPKGQSPPYRRPKAELSPRSLQARMFFFFFSHQERRNLPVVLFFCHAPWGNIGRVLLLYEMQILSSVSSCLGALLRLPTGLENVTECVLCHDVCLCAESTHDKTLSCLNNNSSLGVFSPFGAVVGLCSSVMDNQRHMESHCAALICVFSFFSRPAWQHKWWCKPLHGYLSGDLFWRVQTKQHQQRVMEFVPFYRWLLWRERLVTGAHLFKKVLSINNPSVFSYNKLKVILKSFTKSLILAFIILYHPGWPLWSVTNLLSLSM